MSRPWRVAYATGSRADYGIVRRWLDLLEGDPRIELSILATASMLDLRYGRPVDLVRADGHRVAAEVELPLGSSSASDVASSMGAALVGFDRYLSGNPVDLMVVLGDRYEMLSAAEAAAMRRVPVLHVHGGEATWGNYDEFIRHSITKMAAYHFTATEGARKRVVQLGEDPSRVFWLGSLGVENCLLDEVSSSMEPPFDGPYMVVLFHPETASGADSARQVRVLLDALDYFPSTGFAVIGPNADTGSLAVRDAMRAWCDGHGNAIYFENLRPEDYHRLLRLSCGLVGNSSSGIIEAPSLGVRTVNIGDRQAGRERASSVVDVPCTVRAIYNAVGAALEAPALTEVENPYYRPHAARSYHETTLQILESLEGDLRRPKEFYDVKFEL